MHTAPLALPTPDALPAIGAVRCFAADQTLCGEGERAAHFVLVVAGLVRSCSQFADGRRFIGGFFAAGDMFGFEGRPIYQAAAEAVCDTTAIFYPARDAADAAAMPRQFQGLMMQRMVQAQDHARLLARLSARERLCAFLLQCSARAVARDLITLEMTRQDIADYLGLTVETVSRGLTRLKRDGVIAFPASARQVRLLDVAALRAICADAG